MWGSPCPWWRHRAAHGRDVVTWPEAQGNAVEESSMGAPNSGRGVKHNIRRYLYFVQRLWMEDLPTQNDSRFAVQSTWYGGRQGPFAGRQHPVLTTPPT